MRRLEGRSSSLTSSVKNDADWESFKSLKFLDKVNCVANYYSLIC